MRTYTELQEKVISAAREKLRHEQWFRGICCTNLPEDAEIEEDFDGAVAGVVMETCYWDAPNHGFEV